MDGTDRLVIRLCIYGVMLRHFLCRQDDSSHFFCWNGDDDACAAGFWVYPPNGCPVSVQGVTAEGNKRGAGWPAQ
jgi:hypothetical protein